MNKEELLKKVAVLNREISLEWPHDELIKINHVIDLIDQLDEPSIEKAHDILRKISGLSKKSFDYYWNCINDDVELNEPVELPDFVAAFLEEYKDFSISYILGRRHSCTEVHEWMTEENQKIFVRALLDGYVVKEEPKWRVKNTEKDNKYLFLVNERTLKPIWTNKDEREPMLFDSKEKAEAINVFVGGTVEEVEGE